MYDSLVLILTTTFDGFGTELVIWGYAYKILPTYSRFILADFSVMPVVYMLIYQYCLTWKSFFIVHFIQSFIFAFIAESILVWMGIYVPLSWKHIYSFPIYLVMALVLKMVIGKIIKKQSSS